MKHPLLHTQDVRGGEVTIRSAKTVRIASIMKNNFIQLIDVDTQGPRYDVTPAFADAAAFSALVDEIATHFSLDAFDFVTGIDALGFILGTAIAMHTQKGFIPIRKGGKLPVPTQSVNFIDYSGELKTLEIRTDMLSSSDKVLVVDEWIETGAQVNGAIALIELQGAVVAGIATVNMDDNVATRALQEKYVCYAAWR